MPTGCMCWNMRGSYGKAIPAVLPRRLARVISEFKYGRPIADLWLDPHFIMPVTACQYSQIRGNSRRDRVRRNWPARFEAWAPYESNRWRRRNFQSLRRESSAAARFTLGGRVYFGIG